MSTVTASSAFVILNDNALQTSWLQRIKQFVITVRNNC